MNVADTKPYNADFDGDEMNMHGPKMKKSSGITSLAVSKHIISPANNSSIIGVFKFIIRLYRFTRKDVKFTPKL